MPTEQNSNTNFKTNTVITEKWNSGYKLEAKLIPQQDLEEWQVNFELPQAYTIRNAYGVNLTDNGDGNYTISGQEGRIDLEEGQTIKPIFIIDHDGQEAVPLELTTEPIEGESEPATEEDNSEPAEGSESEPSMEDDNSEPAAEASESDNDIMTNSSIVESWNGGYKLEVELEAESDADDWQLDFDLPSSYTIRNAYGVELTANGDGSYTIKGQDGRADLEQGQSIKPVFIIDHSNGEDVLPEFNSSMMSEADSEPATEDSNSEPAAEADSEPATEENNSEPAEASESEPTAEEGESEPTMENDNSEPAAEASESDNDIMTNASIVESWNGGYKLEVELEAESDADDWQLDFDLPSSYTIRNAYGVELTANGDGSYTIKGQDGRADLEQGQSIKPVFIIDHSNGEDVLPEFNSSMMSEADSEPATEDSNSEPAAEAESEPATEEDNSGSTTEESESEPTMEDGSSESVTEEGDSEPTESDGGFTSTEQQGKFDYGEALQLNFLFLEANRSGDLPEDNRIEWRSDSTLNDGSDAGVDLEGGYFDAGDHIKFIQPMAFSSTMLAWGGIDYEQAYQQSGQLDELRAAVKWGTDWFLKAHETDGDGNTTRLWVQVGDAEDHQYWVPPEKIAEVSDRPSYFIDASRPGSDAAAGTASALASASMLFRGVDDAYADELVKNAVALYEFAETYQAKYSDSVPEASPFYTSFSGYWDELSLGGAWLYKATGDTKYLDKAENYFRDKIGGLGDWTYAADDHSYGAAMILAKESDDPFFKEQYQKWIDTWINEEGGVNDTPNDFAIRTKWASIPINMSTSFAAEWYNDNIEANPTYSKFATDQVNYVLGENPKDFSFQIGFGDNYPLRPHHRGSAGSQGNNDNSTPNDHILHGAVVGGPSNTDINSYNDVRSDFRTNEVGTGYNAPFASAVVQQYADFGGDPLSQSELDALEGIDANGVGVMG